MKGFAACGRKKLNALVVICTLNSVTELVVLRKRMFSVEADKLSPVGKITLIRKNYSPSFFQSRFSTKVSLIWFIPNKFWSYSSKINYCLYKHATQQYAGWATDNDCKLWSSIVFRRLSRRPKVQFPQEAVQADDSKTSTVSPQCLRLLYSICSFSSLQVATRRN